jgi:hypothetical protein
MAAIGAAENSMHVLGSLLLEIGKLLAHGEGRRRHSYTSYRALE